MYYCHNICQWSRLFCWILIKTEMYWCKFEIKPQVARGVKQTFHTEGAPHLPGWRPRTKCNDCFAPFEIWRPLNKRRGQEIFHNQRCKWAGERERHQWPGGACGYKTTCPEKPTGNKLSKAKSCSEMRAGSCSHSPPLPRAHQGQHSAGLQGADAGEEHQEPEHEAHQAPEEGDVHQSLPTPVGWGEEPREAQLRASLELQKRQKWEKGESETSTPLLLYPLAPPSLSFLSTSHS